MKLKSTIAAIVLTLPAFAMTSVSATEAFNPSAYVGGGLGFSDFKFDCPSGFSCSRPDVNFKLLGGYQFSPNFAIEGGYTNFGTIKARYQNSEGKARLHSFTLAGLGIVPLTNEAQLFGKLGMHFSSGKGSVDNPDIKFHVSDSYHKNGLLLGVGMQYDFTKNFAGRLEYEYLHFGNNPLSVDKSSLNLFSLGLLYKF